MNIYTPQDLVRLELLRYENPEGLHPVESAWRDLARKLMEDLEAQGQLLSEHHNPSRQRSYGECQICSGYKPMKFPTKFKPQ